MTLLGAVGPPTSLKPDHRPRPEAAGAPASRGVRSWCYLRGRADPDPRPPLDHAGES